MAYACHYVEPELVSVIDLWHVILTVLFSREERFEEANRRLILVYYQCFDQLCGPSGRCNTA